MRKAIKRTIAVIFTMFIFTSAMFAEPEGEVSTWAEFEQKILATYPWLDYVAYSVYEKWGGDAEAFLTHLYENPIDLDAEEIPDAI